MQIQYQLFHRWLSSSTKENNLKFRIASAWIGFKESSGNLFHIQFDISFNLNINWRRNPESK